MQYEKILSNQEIEFALNTKLESTEIEQLKTEFYIKLIKKFPWFSINDNKKFELLLYINMFVYGNVKNNNPNLICPNCGGKYVVRNFYGDLFYRSFHGTKEQIEAENEKFSKMGLYSNPYEVDVEKERDYECLNCFVRWNKINENIIKN